MNLCIIPARGGSKRIPKKNIKNFCGKPIILWVIKTAKLSNCFDRIIVSTDDSKIAKLCKNNGIEVPFIRPKEISDDHSDTASVISHSINWFKQNNENPTNVCCLYATAALISSKDIQKGFKIYKNSNVNFAFTATSYPYPIQRSFKINKNNEIKMFYPKNYRKRSQDFEQAFHDAGQFYWGKAEAWLRNKIIFDSKSIPILIPRYKAQDIDTLEDWKNAELIFKALHSK